MEIQRSALQRNTSCVRISYEEVQSGDISDYFEIVGVMVSKI